MRSAILTTLALAFTSLLLTVIYGCSNPDPTPLPDATATSEAKALVAAEMASAALKNDGGQTPAPVIPEPPAALPVPADNAPAAPPAPPIQPEDNTPPPAPVTLPAAQPAQPPAAQPRYYYPQSSGRFRFFRGR